MNDQVAIGWCTVRRRECQTEARGDGSARRIDIDKGHVGRRELPQQKSGERTDHAGTHDRDFPEGAGACVPNGVQRGFHVGGQDRAGGGHRAGTTTAAVAGTSNKV